MAMYKREFYDKSGKKTVSALERYPSDIGRWQQNVKRDRSDKSVKSSTFKSKPTKSGLNRKVTSSKTVFKDGSVMKTTLISNSGRTPKRGRK